jgi:1-acyl-sn-glycerol-3-phosphate acyltransferase
VSQAVGWLKLRAMQALIAGDMFARAFLAPRLWWLRHRNRIAEADALVGRMALNWSRNILRRFQCEVRIEGLHLLPPAGPLIIAANHQSLFDIPVCLGFLGRAMGFVAKQELFRIPGLAYWMRQIHCVSIDRKDIAAGGRLLEELSRNVRERGYCMIIFPEGTRSRHPDGELGPFRRGALRIAQSAGIPVLPLSIDGTRFLVSPPHLRATRAGGRVVRMKLAPPLMPPPPDAPAPQAKRFMDGLRETIVSNRNAIRVHWPRD